MINHRFFFLGKAVRAGDAQDLARCRAKIAFRFVLIILPTDKMLKTLIKSKTMALAEPKRSWQPFRLERMPDLPEAISARPPAYRNGFATSSAAGGVSTLSGKFLTPSRA